MNQVHLLLEVPLPDLRPARLIFSEQSIGCDEMKRSLRSFFLVLLLLSTFLTYLFSRFAIPSCFFLPRKCNHATLLSLSTHDASTKLFVQSEVSDLLRASIESFDTYGGIHRTISLWGRIRSDISDRRKSLARIRLPISPQNGYPPDRHVILPLFRQSLAEWAHHHSLKFSDSITIDLIQHIKNPIEIFSGRPNTGEPYSSCAVVGNSGILVGSNHGELIDSHEFVIRLNNAKIIGYEKDVGSKSSLSFVNSNILHLCTRRDKCYCHPYGETVPILMYICQPKHFLDYVICNYSHKAPLLITDPRFDNLCTRIAKYYSLKLFVDTTGRSPTRWNETREETTFHYSSGLQAVMLALGICKRVSIFGFGKLKGAKHHYHTNQKVELDLHDYEAEYMFYRDLIQRPEMIPFLAEFRVPHLVFYH